MKAAKLFFTALLVISQFFFGITQAMTNSQTTEQPLNVVESGLHLQKNANNVAETVACQHHVAMQHDKTMRTNASPSYVASAEHDCCEQASMHSDNTSCPSCGDNCICGISCHFISYSMLDASLQPMQIHTLTQNAGNQYSAAIRPIYLSLEEIPPKTFPSALS